MNKPIVALLTRRTVARYAIASLFLVAPAPLLAHGGGIDGYGCHNDRKHGGYHCHRGPLAGQSFASQQEMLAAMQRSPQQPTSKSTK
jgi:hypothetical protein